MVKKINTKKKYVPNSKEKYMCAKHKKFFTEELLNWKKDIEYLCNIFFKYHFYKKLLQFISY